nr:NUDIX domain-containing protein [Jannaschia sp. Os4]
MPVLRRDGRVLAFRHPQAGLQLPKGRIEPRERPVDAAIRELHEEAGIFARAVRARGRVPGLGWHLVEMEAGPLPPRWTHRCADDGGHLFAYFWHPLDAPPRGFAAPYRRALAAIARWT